MKQFALQIANLNDFDGTAYKKFPSFWPTGREKLVACLCFESLRRRNGRLRPSRYEYLFRVSRDREHTGSVVEAVWFTAAIRSFQMRLIGSSMR